MGLCEVLLVERLEHGCWSCSEREVKVTGGTPPYRSDINHPRPMPKRTNPFQELIALIESVLVGSGACLTESEELVDRHTGKRREVDVVIRNRVGTHEIVISVECTATGRPATVEWVEQQHGKHASLETDKLILVSQAGFTAEAQVKADGLGISALSLSEAGQLDWEATVLKIPSITLASYLEPVITQVTAVLRPECASIDDLDPSEFGEGHLIPSDDDVGPTCMEYVNRRFSDPRFVEQLLQMIPDDGDWTIEVELPLKDGVRLETTAGGRHPISALLVKASCKVEHRDVPLSRVTYGPAAVVHGSSASFGRPMRIVFAQRPGEQAAFVIRIDKEHNKDKGCKGNAEAQET